MTGPHLFTGARILEPGGARHGWLRVVDGRIDRIGNGVPPHGLTEAATVTDVDGLTLAPGFIDLHIHGAVGHEAMDGNVPGLQAMARFLAEHGVTSFLPSTWTAEREETAQALATIASTIGRVEGGASVLGAHMEGPYLSHGKCGAHRPHLLREPTVDEVEEFLASGAVRLMALAPELAANAWLIDVLVERGVTVAAGHTTASLAEMETAVARGVSHVTHLFNGMSGLHHREPGTVGAALTRSELRCELVADNVHVHPAAIRLAWQAKGRHGLILVSDAGKAAGMPDGEYVRAGRTVTSCDGAVTLPDGTIAGSVLTLDVALRNVAEATGASVDELWPITSLNAARSIGVADRKGSLEPGKDADLVLLDDALQVRATYVMGDLVYDGETGLG